MGEHNSRSREALRRASESMDACVAFLRELIALPSPSRAERLACERVVREMEELGYEEIRIDDMGNVIGRLGSGPRCIALDAHIDTVGISRPSSWPFDPFRGLERDGILYGRGASDQKGGLAAIVYGAAIAAEMGLPEGLQILVTASVSGEDCVGLAWQHLIEVEGLQPECVLIAMPSNLALCRGQRGRLELDILTEGVSSHGAEPDRGRNAINAMAPIVLAVSRLHGTLKTEDPMLGRGSIAVTNIASESPSLTAIPDGCRIHVDRRLTIGESVEEAIEQLESLEEMRAESARIEISSYHDKSWRGLEKSVRKIFPPWETQENSLVFQVGAATAELVLEKSPLIHRSAFSSNACSIAGQFGIPAIGFGPASEKNSHSTKDQILLAQLVPAMAFYALFPAMYRSA